MKSQHLKSLFLFSALLFFGVSLIFGQPPREGNGNSPGTTTNECDAAPATMEVVLFSSQVLNGDQLEANVKIDPCQLRQVNCGCDCWIFLKVQSNGQTNLDLRVISGHVIQSTGTTRLAANELDWFPRENALLIHIGRSTIESSATLLIDFSEDIPLSTEVVESIGLCVSDNIDRPDNPGYFASKRHAVWNYFGISPGRGRNPRNR